MKGKGLILRIRMMLALNHGNSAIAAGEKGRWFDDAADAAADMLLCELSAQISQEVN